MNKTQLIKLKERIMFLEDETSAAKTTIKNAKKALESKIVLHSELKSVALARALLMNRLYTLNGFLDCIGIDLPAESCVENTFASDCWSTFNKGTNLVRDALLVDQEIADVYEKLYLCRDGN